MSRRLGKGYVAIKPQPNLSIVGDRMASLIVKKGKTRGKNPRDIEYMAFDLEKPDSLPKSLNEFMEATGVKEQADIVSYLVDGFNSAQYSAASDEIGEFINDAWDKDTQAQFRLAVRNYSKLLGSDIETAVNLIKPGVDKAWEAKAAKAKAEAEKQPETEKQTATA